MTPPSTLRLGGLAAAALGVLLMAANGREARPATPPEAAETQMAYALAQLAQADQSLAATRHYHAAHQLSPKPARAAAVATVPDSASTAVRVSREAVVKAGRR